jgi:hypothetical protein
MHTITFHLQMVSFTDDTKPFRKISQVFLEKLLSLSYFPTHGKHFLWHWGNQGHEHRSLETRFQSGRVVQPHHRSTHVQYDYVIKQIRSRTHNGALPTQSIRHSCPPRAGKFHVVGYEIGETNPFVLQHVYPYVKVKLSYPCNRPWRPIALWDVKDPTLSRQSAHS